MFETSSKARSELFALIQSYLADKRGPIRIERLPARLLGIEWKDMSYDDRFIVAGVVARLGWIKRWPHWFAPGHDPRQAPRTPIDAPAATSAALDAGGDQRAA